MDNELISKIVITEEEIKIHEKLERYFGPHYYKTMLSVEDQYYNFYSKFTDLGMALTDFFVSGGDMKKGGNHNLNDAIVFSRELKNSVERSLNRAHKNGDVLNDDEIATSECLLVFLNNVISLGHEVTQKKLLIVLLALIEIWEALLEVA
jgi:hypothetical protein